MVEKNPLRPPANRPLENKTCPYCGVDLGTISAIKEHVVGRRFVPKGKFAGNWNLILRACDPCNRIKSGLEDDISAISLLLPGALTGEDPSLATDVLHKARNSFSRRTLKAVADSSETIVHSGCVVPGVTYKAALVTPPQIDRDRAFELAWYQLTGFFYLLTYDHIAREGRSWPGGCLPISVVMQRDWGNAVHRWFMASVAGWHERIMGTMADGFYRIAVRRHPDSDVWSWALEWNKTIRVIGLFGDEVPLRDIARTMPAMPMHEMSSTDGTYLRVRIEVPLEQESDIMFSHSEIEG